MLDSTFCSQHDGSTRFVVDEKQEIYAMCAALNTEIVYHSEAQTDSIAKTAAKLTYQFGPTIGAIKPSDINKAVFFLDLQKGLFLTVQQAKRIVKAAFEENKPYTDTSKKVLLKAVLSRTLQPWDVVSMICSQPRTRSALAKHVQKTVSFII